MFVGDGSAAPGLTRGDVQPGDIITVSCLPQSATAVKVFRDVNEIPVTVPPGASLPLTITGPFWLQAATIGVAGCQLTGGYYGAN